MKPIKRIATTLLRHHTVVGPASYLVRRRPTEIDQATWDRDYVTGRWAYLGDLAEMSRYAAIAGYCRSISPGGSMLDIGCGDGHLFSWVCHDKIRRYVGIDLSSVAIEKAREHAVNQARFEVADAATLSPDSRFDIIVFNEMLYYMNNPEQVLARYEDFLSPNGFMIISMFRSTASLRTWRRCGARLEVLDELRIRAANANVWDIRLCRPTSARIDTAGR
jgi:2-polyprenyl-3-methyl-5-hydroxy-6-metoxy-1,4-benzoquinol methylase